MYWLIYRRVLGKIPFSLLAHLVSITGFIYLKLRLVFINIYLTLNKNDVDISFGQAEDLLKIGHDEKNELPFFDLTAESKCFLSVIIPAYNAEKTIMQCYESIAGQKITCPYEIIIIDDGSKDGTAEILDKIQNKDKSVRVYHQSNSGIAYTRNKGVCYACGEYILFVDSDDFLEDNSLNKLLSVAYEKRYDMVEGGTVLLQGTTRLYMNDVQHRTSFYKNLEEDPRFIRTLSAVPWGRLYRRELYSGCFFPDGYDYEDTMIFFLIFRKAKSYYYVSENFTVHEIEGGSITQQLKGSRKSLDSYWVLKPILKKYFELNLPKDDVFYQMLLQQFSTVLYKRVGALSVEEKKALLVIGKAILKDYEYLKNDRYFTLKEKVVEKAILQLDVKSWQAACKF